MAPHERINPELLGVLPPDARRIVEVGHGTGALAEEYRRINPQAEYLQIAPGADVAGIEPESVDCLVYADVFGTLLDPWSLVRTQAAWLRPDGIVTATVANIGHWSVLAGLLRGSWRYEEGALPDRGDLRFFTAESTVELFRAAGLPVFDVRALGPIGQAFPQFVELLSPVLVKLGIDPRRFAERAAAPRLLVRAVKAAHRPRPLTIWTAVGEPLVCARPRVHEPNQFLATIPGVRTLASDWFVPDQLLPGEDAVCIWQRRFIRYPDERDVQDGLLRRGCLVVVECDDDPTAGPGLGSNNCLALRGSHAIQVASEPLAEFVRRFNPHVAVFPNQLAALPPPFTLVDGPMRLFFGALNRQADWQPLLPELNRVLTDYRGRVSMIVVSDQLLFDALATADKVFEPMCPYERYIRLLRGCDIALLPLEPTPFNLLKSDLKFLECAAHGVVALASPVVYGESLRDGETGLLFRSPAEFGERLRMLIEDAELRARLTRAAYSWVGQYRLLGRHYRRRYEWYRQLLSTLPQLTAELRKRAPEFA